MGKIKEIIDEILETTSAHNYRAKNAVLASAELTALIERATTAERERDELTAQLQAVTAERNRFADYLAATGYKPRCTCTMDDNMHEPSCSMTEWTRIRFERMAPLDWREYNTDETPFGQQLDGMGDEVEP
jgi:hypothetical protein